MAKYWWVLVWGSAAGMGVGWVDELYNIKCKEVDRYT